jgi:hypothetical protein
MTDVNLPLQAAASRLVRNRLHSKVGWHGSGGCLNGCRQCVSVAAAIVAAAARQTFECTKHRPMCYAGTLSCL